VDGKPAYEEIISAVENFVGLYANDARIAYETSSWLEQRGVKMNQSNVDKIIEEAKSRLLNDMKAEEEKKKKAELEKTQDPVHLMTTKLDRLVELLINKPKVEVEEVIEVPKKKRVVKPKQPRKPRKTSSEDITQESGDVFVGDSRKQHGVSELEGPGTRLSCVSYCDTRMANVK
jgi:hypothetical protein